MSVYLNSQKVRPMLNGHKMNAYLNNHKIWNDQPPTDDYLTFTFTDANGALLGDEIITPKATASGVSLEYSLNGGVTWNSWTNGNEIFVNSGVIKFRGFCPTGSLFTSSVVQNSWSLPDAPDVYVKASGNIMSLIDYSNTHTSALGANAFAYMFYQCTSLTKAPELPANTIPTNCYNNLFSGCTGLILSDNPTVDATSEYRLPSTGSWTGGSSSNVLNMFYNVPGTRTTPTYNMGSRTYYQRAA